MTSPRARPRVLQIGKYYPPHRGGIETHVETLCRAMSRDVEMEVLVANAGRRTIQERVDGIRVTRLASLGCLAGAPLCPALTGVIRSAAFDLVHLHHPNPTAVLAYLASGRREPLVASYHSDIIRQRALGRCFAPVLRRFLDRAAAVLVSTSGYLDSSPVLGAYRPRCRVVPYGIPGDEGAGVEAVAAAIRARYGPRLVLGVGRFVYYKGFAHLVQAMRDVRGRLLLVGDGPLRGALERQAAALALDDRVVFLGAVADVDPYYRAADVFVLPSVARSEAFGLVQLEAMRRGTPVVNTHLDSGVPFVSLHGVTGLTVPPADAAALARAINELLDDDRRRAELGAAARRRVEAEFRAEVMAERTLAVYREVLGTC